MTTRISLMALNEIRSRLIASTVPEPEDVNVYTEEFVESARDIADAKEKLMTGTLTPDEAKSYAETIIRAANNLSGAYWNAATKTVDKKLCAGGDGLFLSFKG